MNSEPSANRIDWPKAYQELLEVDPNALGATSSLLPVLAHGIDASIELRREAGCLHASSIVDALLTRADVDTHYPRLRFFQGNCWTNLRSIRNETDPASTRWPLQKSSETEKAIRCFREALYSQHFEVLEIVEKCQILTNLAVELRRIGRSVDALAYYEQAIQLEQRFGMALGGKGVALCDLARWMPSVHDQIRLWAEAHSSLSRSLKEPKYEVEAEESFRSALRTFDPYIERGLLDLTRHSFTKQEYVSTDHMEYVTWCSRQMLQLNPVNEIGICGVDSVHLTPISFERIPTTALLGIFNLLKQEFTSARYLLYEGINAKDPHWSDNSVVLVDTLDYPAYGLAIEKAKAAFRASYSLLDKISFFINEYWQLGIPLERVSFRNCWFDRGERKYGVHPKFLASGNLALLALHWLNKDFYDDENDTGTPLEPRARELYLLRRHLEHRYVKVHSDLSSTRHEKRAINDPLEDHLSFSINRDDLFADGILLLRLVRNALLYLVIAVRSEDSQSGKGRAPGVTLPIVPDDWKL